MTAQCFHSSILFGRVILLSERKALIKTPCSFSHYGIEGYWEQFPKHQLVYKELKEKKKNGKENFYFLHMTFLYTKTRYGQIKMSHKISVR